jgi:hypothetical protein
MNELPQYNNLAYEGIALLGLNRAEAVLVQA